MIPYVKDITSLFVKHKYKKSKVDVTPALDHLLKVYANAAPLKQQKIAVLQKFVTKYFFATKHARPEISTSFSFIATRIKLPDKNDWEKLTRMIRYFRGNPELALTISANSTPVLKWWVDGSRGFHPNIRVHTGGFISLGKGMPITVSNRQKLSTCRSTKTKLVAADYFMPNILWTNYFLENQ